MRKLITSFIGPNVAMPIKQGALEHLQLAYQEAITALGRANIGNSYDPTKVYILYGCVNSGTHPNYNISAGAVFFNGEVYLVDATVFVAADTAVGTITTSYFASPIADPVTFTDGVARNVHEIKKMVIADGASGSGDADFADFIPNGWILSTSTAGVTYSGLNPATTNSISIYYKRIGGGILLNYFFDFNLINDSAESVQIFVPLPVPAKANSIKYSAFAYCVNNATRFPNGLTNLTTDTILQGSFSPGTNITGQTTIGGQIFYENE